VATEMMKKRPGQRYFRAFRAKALRVELDPE
jgi:hypothetical protein